MSTGNFGKGASGAGAFCWTPGSGTSIEAAGVAPGAARSRSPDTISDPRKKANYGSSQTSQSSAGNSRATGGGARVPGPNTREQPRASSAVLRVTLIVRVVP